MKKIFAAFVMVAALSTAAFAASADVVVKGMVCSFCAQGLTKKFGAKPEVQDVKVTLSDSSMRLTFKEGASMPDAEIKQIVEDSGFELEEIKRD